MIICHSKQFIYLHGRKTAGSSIGMHFMPYLASGDAVRGYIWSEGTLIEPPDWNEAWKYIRPTDIFRDCPLQVAGYRRFVKNVHGIAVVHPTAADVRDAVGEGVWNSYYKFTFERNPFDRMVSFFFWRTKGIKNPPDFSDFIKALHANDTDWLRTYNLMGYSNKPFYTIDDDVVVDTVGQFSNLIDDFRKICEKIGVPTTDTLPRNKTKIRQKRLR